MSESMESIQKLYQQEQAQQQGGAAVKKVRLLGRERTVMKEGRSSFVMIKGQKVPLKKVKEMDKEYKAAKKAQELKKKEAAKKKAVKAKEAAKKKAVKANKSMKPREK